MTELHVPGDKSITHRSLMLACLAEGTSRITGVLAGGDTRSTAEVLRQLGAEIPELDPGAEILIHASGLRTLNRSGAELDCGNSGTTARLMMGIVAGLPLEATFTGDPSLQSRPMRRVTEPLQNMGARVHELSASGRLPIFIEGGGLRPMRYLRPHASAQVKSSLLLAGLTGGVDIEVTEEIMSRDHTERMLRAMGVPLEWEASRTGSYTVRLSPVRQLEPLVIRVPGDFSSAAFLVAASLLGVIEGVRVLGVGVNPTRTGFLEIVREMGGDVTLENGRMQGGEPVADIVARPSELRGIDIGGDLIPRLIDEAPILAILAARAQGQTRLTDAAELRVKESDRISMMVENLNAIGVTATEQRDGMSIEGSARPLAGAVRTALDHRIAMSFGILARQRGNNIKLDDPDIVAISFPEFWRVLEGAV
jgi:3-phosphoshikimate 1-carboxyvinyltransferase